MLDQQLSSFLELDSDTLLGRSSSLAVPVMGPKGQTRFKALLVAPATTQHEAVVLHYVHEQRTSSAQCLNAPWAEGPFHLVFGHLGDGLVGECFSSVEVTEKTGVILSSLYSLQIISDVP